jgi:hypothetical protein
VSGDNTLRQSHDIGRVFSSGQSLRQLGDIGRNPSRLVAQSNQPLARTWHHSAKHNCRVSVHDDIFIFCASQFRLTVSSDCGLGGMGMGGDRTLFGKSMTDLERVSDYAGVKPPRRTNDLLALNNDDVLDLLRAAVKRERSQAAFARHHGINRSHLNMVLRGKRRMGHAVADALGLRIVYIAK